MSTSATFYTYENVGLATASTMSGAAVDRSYVNVGLTEPVLVGSALTESYLNVGFELPEEVVADQPQRGWGAAVIPRRSVRVKVQLARATYYTHVNVGELPVPAQDSAVAESYVEVTA
jgi:hypothetical protein